jgi:hypothetical protein
LVTTFIRFLLVGVWLAASVVLGTGAVLHHQTLRITSAIIVGLPGALTLASNIRGLSGPSEDTKQRLRRILQSAVVELAQHGVSAGDLVGVGLHVWLVPPWYRFLFPFQLRRHLAGAPRWLRRLRLRPKLICVARYRVQPHDRSGLGFRKGVGLVGRCVAHNQPGQIHIVKLGTQAFRAATADEDRWRVANVTTTQNLSLKAAQSLARIYGEAAALGIKDASGDALGCVTLEFAAGSPLHLPQPNKKAAKSDIFLLQLRNTAELVQTQLQHGGDS